MNTDIASLLAQHKGGMSAKQVSEITGLEYKHLLSMAKANRIPSVNVGGRVIFDPFRVSSWWRSKETPYTPIEREPRTRGPICATRAKRHSQPTASPRS